MNYTPYTTRVKSALAEIKVYPLVNLDINVDGTACLLVKYADRKYYEEKVSRENMNLESDDLARLIHARVENYFNGWAVKKGLAQR
jgi:hypothetical protein